MNEKRIFITGIGGDIGQSILKCLNDMKTDFLIVGSDIDPYAASRNEISKFYIAPDVNDEKKYVDFILKVIKENEVDYFLPATEPEISCSSKNIEKIESENVKVMINRKKIIETFLDKYNTVDFLKKNGMNYPKTFLFENYEDQLEFPVLLKPRSSYGGKKLIKIEKSSQLSFFRKRLKDYIVQEYLPEELPEYTVGVFSNGNEIYHIAFIRKLGYGSLTKVAELVLDNEIKSMAQKIAKKCDLRGSINIQMKKKGNEYIPFEVNPRLSSTVYIRHFFGFEDVKWWIDLFENKKIDYKLKYQKGIGVRRISEIFFDLDS